MIAPKSTAFRFLIARRLLPAAMVIPAIAASVFCVGATWPAPQANFAQAPIPQWQKDAGGKMAFGVGSVRQNKSGPPPSGDKQNSNIPLDDSDAYPANGGYFRATNLPLIVYLIFAYKIGANEYSSLQSELPKWAAAEQFDIQARADGNPSKDQMRLMLQSLLADRFKLAVHFETRQLPVFGLALIKPGKMGPQLSQHSETPPCPDVVSLPAGSAVPVLASGLPAICGVLSRGGDAAPGHIHLSGRNITMSVIGSDLGYVAQRGRPVIDRTGLSGTFDFIADWIPDSTAPLTPGTEPPPEQSGPTFLEALKDQLGLKLEPQTGPVDVLAIDHVEEPSAN